MKHFASRFVPLLATLAITGCANVVVDTTGASPATLEKLRAANVVPVQVGAFQLAPGKPPAIDTKSASLRGSRMRPAKGSWAQLLKDTLVVELTAAGLYDPSSRFVIEGQLTASKIDAPIKASTGTARLAARFIVTNDGRVEYDKELAVDTSWESSFFGAIAIPRAMNQYSALYTKLVARLFDDPDFQRALAK
ncbi:MAG: hypothetical protein LBF61_09335 [Azoarcus sp.]|jgi:hypothetical protein|nr:hypothetical protein [Azoarcus sp.]